MRVISSGADALIAAQQLDDKKSGKKHALNYQSRPPINLSRLCGDHQRPGPPETQGVWGRGLCSFCAHARKSRMWNVHARGVFLTRDDRRLLGDVYEWASAQELI